LTIDNQIKDLEAQIEEDRELLAASSSQIDEKDQAIDDLEDQVGKLQSQIDKVQNGKKYLLIPLFLDTVVHLTDLGNLEL
jgi:hypothetical protein